MSTLDAAHLLDELVAINTGRRPRLLVVDDDPSVRLLLTTLLDGDYDVVAADGGAAAIDILRTDATFDLAILDIMMPDVDGFEVANAIADNRPRTAVVMLSALTDHRSRRRAEDVGAATYITKPFDPDLLEATIEMLLGPAEQSSDEAAA